jgi:hypothetical protein
VRLRWIFRKRRVRSLDGLHHHEMLRQLHAIDAKLDELLKRKAAEPTPQNPIKNIRKMR